MRFCSCNPPPRREPALRPGVCANGRFLCAHAEMGPGRGGMHKRTNAHHSLRIRRTSERERASTEGTTPEIKAAIKCCTSSKCPFPPNFARITMSASIMLRGYKTPGRCCLHARCTVVLAFHWRCSSCSSCSLATSFACHSERRVTGMNGLPGVITDELPALDA